MKFDDMNDDCLDNIFSFLEFKEQVSVLCVCRRWKILIDRQFRRLRNLLVTPEVKYPNDNFDPINYQARKDAHTFQFSYLQNRSILFPAMNFIQIIPTIKSDREDSLLVLSIPNKVNWNRFDSLIDKFSNLKSIKFNSNKNRRFLSSNVLNSIFERCRSLSSINLTDSNEVNSDCLLAISKCQALEHLDLTNCKNYGNNGLKNVLKNCSQLKALFIGYNHRLTGQFFRYSNARVKYLDLTDLTNLKNKGFDALSFSQRESLEALITFPLKTEKSLKFICKKFLNLRALKLYLSAPLDLQILFDEPNLRNLRAISLNDSIQLTDELFMKMMTNFEKIQEFELVPNTPLQTYFPLLDIAKYWPNLTRLRLFNVILTPIQNKAILKSFLQLKHLNSICISITGIDDESHVVWFIENMFNGERNIKFFNLEYFRNENNSSSPFCSIQNQLKTIEKRGYYVITNQLKLNKIPPYLYLTKISVRKYEK